MVRHRQPGSLYGLSHAWLCSYIGDRCLHMIITIIRKHTIKIGDSMRYFRLLLSTNCHPDPDSSIVQKLFYAQSPIFILPLLFCS